MPFYPSFSSLVFQGMVKDFVIASLKVILKNTVYFL